MCGRVSHRLSYLSDVEKRKEEAILTTDQNDFVTRRQQRRMHSARGIATPVIPTQQPRAPTWTETDHTVDEERSNLTSNPKITSGPLNSKRKSHDLILCGEGTSFPALPPKPYMAKCGQLNISGLTLLFTKPEEHMFPGQRWISSRVGHEEPVQQPGPYELAVLAILHRKKSKRLSPNETRAVAAQRQELRNHVHWVDLARYM